MERFYKIGVQYKTATKIDDLELYIHAESHLLAKCKAISRFNEIMPCGTLLTVY